MGRGKVYLVGAGPGDPGLLTVKGQRCLEQADAIVYDRLASPRLLQYAKQDVELYYAGKAVDNHTLPQGDIEQLLVSLADRGLRVVRLKGGDPFVFGRGGEEADALNNAGIEWEVVPGITSAVSVPAYAGIPVTYRNVSPSFTVVTGHRAQDGGIDWAQYAALQGTLVVLMGVRELTSIVKGLVDAGRDLETPVALVRWGTRAQQETLVGTLGDIVDRVRDARFRSPAVIIVGEVVSQREQLEWYERLPLMGKRVFVSAQTQKEMHAMEELVEGLGGEAFGLCAQQLTFVDTSDIQATFDEIRFAQADTRVGLYFRTGLGVQTWFEALYRNRVDLRALACTRFAATNEEVAQALSQHGVYSDAVGGRALQSLDVATWWCESPSLSEADAIRLYSPLSTHAQGSTVRYFRTYEVGSASQWVQLAEEWLADGVDVLWTTPEDASVVEAHLCNHLSSGIVRVSQPASVGSEQLLEELRALLWTGSGVYSFEKYDLAL